ncbi:type 1 glutamine amidotransferase domain-containing protein [Sphingomonas agri]|uniref:type 1 glutamine amidotransferase domain-containing protein n=1 Tax=Sphingomonas agri TaxID=1813878 RepID=UPI00311DA71B
MKAIGHRDINPASPKPKRIALVVSNPAKSTTTGWPVGFWWSEIAHPFHVFAEHGYDVEIFSPDGGPCEGDPLSDPRDPSRWSAGDLITTGFVHTPEYADLLKVTSPVAEIDPELFDAIVVAGGQGPMFTFEEATGLHRLFARFFEMGKIACALCHGVAVLRYARLSDGSLLARGKIVTGFTNAEEDAADEATWAMGALPRGTSIMPWRIEDELDALGAIFTQGGLRRSFATRDGNLITGQQNFSGSETAALVVAALGS